MLNDLDQATLAFERSWWKHAGAKDAAIMATFGETATRYYQRLNALLDLPDALAYDAQTVNRLRRLRAARRTQRAQAVTG